MLFDGNLLSARTCDDASWLQMQAANRCDPARLILDCCRRRAFAKVSGQRTRFFQHAPREADSIECDREGESESHRQIKRAIVQAISTVDGWSAEEEVAGLNWRADVLARHRNGDIPPVAFEVQLSRQSGEVTRQRDAAYADEGVTAVWLVNQHNDLPSFGSDRRLPLKPEADGGRAEASARAACSYLRLVEWQIRAAHAAMSELEQFGAETSLIADHAMPAIVYSPNFGGEGGVRITFAMAGLCDLDRDLPRGPGAIPAGQALPLYVRRKRTERNQSLDRYAVSIDNADPVSAGRGLIRDLAEGRLSYRPWFALPVSLVHYTETCRGCVRQMEVCRWAVIAGGTRAPMLVPEGFRTTLPFVLPASEFGRPGDFRDSAWATAEKRLGGSGRLLPAKELGDRPSCPGCADALPPHRISKEDALAWPAEHQDGWWYDRHERQSVWIRMVPASSRSPAVASQHRWQDTFAQRSADVNKEISASLMAKAQADREREEEARIRRQQAEQAQIERRAREAEAKAARDEAARAAEARWAAQEREAREARERAAADVRLRTAEEIADRLHPGRSDLAALWLNSARRGGSFRQRAIDSDRGLAQVQDQERRDRR